MQAELRSSHESSQRSAPLVNDAKKRVAVIGGGIGGLASAHYLLNAGITPVVFEAGDRLGGLATWFEHEGVHLDRWYHVILDSDADLCGLLKELDIADRLIWRETGMGFRLGGKLYGFNSPLDLLRFRALSFPDRIRTGLGAAYITKIKKHGLDLDDVYACDWLRSIFGPKIYAQIWEPLAARQVRRAHQHGPRVLGLEHANAREERRPRGQRISARRLRGLRRHACATPSSRAAARCACTVRWTRSSPNGDDGPRPTSAASRSASTP